MNLVGTRSGDRRLRRWVADIDLHGCIDTAPLILLDMNLLRHGRELLRCCRWSDDQSLFAFLIFYKGELIFWLLGLRALQKLLVRTLVAVVTPLGPL